MTCDLLGLGRQLGDPGAAGQAQRAPVCPIPDLFDARDGGGGKMAEQVVRAQRRAERKRQITSDPFRAHPRARRRACDPIAMQSSTVDIKTADGVADAYLTRPDGEGQYPAVLFIIDAIGLRPRIEEMADRIAAEGYVVLAPNVFYRAGRAPVVPVPDLSDSDKRAEFMQSIRPLMAQMTPEAITSDAAAYLDYLADVAPGPVAITGYCMGGRLGFRIAAAFPDRVAALGAFHAGGLVTDRARQPASIGWRREGRALLRARRPGPEHESRADRRARPGTRRGGRAPSHRGLRGRDARIHDVRHAGVQRGGD